MKSIMNRNKKVWLLPVVFCMFLVLFFTYGCGRKEKAKGEKGKVSGEVSQKVKQEKVIKIGAILPLTGSAAEIAEQHKEGIDFAVEEINRKGGIRGKRLEVIYEDDRNDPKQTVSAFNKLVDINKVAVVITVMSSPSMAVYPLAESKNVILFANCGYPGITELSDWVFRDFPTSGQEARRMVRFAYENLQIRKLSILYINDAFGEGAMKVIKKEFEKQGGKILTVESFEKNKIDFKSSITRVLQSQPEAIYIYGYGKANGLVIKQIRELGYKGYILGSYNFSVEPSLSIAKDALEGTYFTAPSFNPNSSEEKIRQFVKGFKEKYGTLPLWNTVYEYDAVHILAEAISKEGYSGKAIQRGLRAIGDFTGLAGKYRALPYGEWESELTIKTFKRGRQLIVEK